MKTCCKCGLSKLESDFTKDRSRPDGLYPQCKKCRKLNNIERSNTRKDWELRNYYGLTLIDFQQMILDQNGLCAICFKSFNDESKVPCVDHCHDTGEIRGILCRSCNTMLGQANDNIEILLSGISYLNKHST